MRLAATKLRQLTSLQMAEEFGHVIRVDYAQEVDVVIAVKPRHLVSRDGLWPEDFHFAVEAIVYDKVVRHAYAVRLHWVTLAIVIVPYLCVIKVRDFPLSLHGHFDSRFP